MVRRLPLLVSLAPDSVGGLRAIEKSLTLEKLDGWISSARSRSVTLLLPRFKTNTEFALGGTLMGMGMRAAFYRGQADFSGMDGQRDIYVSLVVHKAFVEVGEEGTEAAAATGVGMTWGHLEGSFDPVRFIVDHPFLFLIRDNASRAILFMGRITTPLS